jgi:hypothetical protein
MRRSLLLALCALCGLLALAWPARAENSAQWAGCASPDELPSAVSFLLKELRGESLVITALGVGGFDPALTLEAPDGTPLLCSDNAQNPLPYALRLPTVQAVSDAQSAQIRVDIPDDRPPADYFLRLTSADGRSGQVVLLIEGAEIFGASDVDTYHFFSTRAQADAEVPFNVYVANTRRPEYLTQFQITVAFGQNFSQTCRKSSARVLCQGDHTDLTGYAITDPKGRERVLNGDDVMLAYVLGGDPTEFILTVESYQKASFGPYTLAIHLGVVYPDLRGG